VRVRAYGGRGARVRHQRGILRLHGGYFGFGGATGGREQCWWQLARPGPPGREFGQLGVAVAAGMPASARQGQGQGEGGPKRPADVLLSLPRWASCRTGPCCTWEVMPISQLPRKNRCISDSIYALDA
jgi:hypothetical protein